MACAAFLEVGRIRLKEACDALLVGEAGRIGAGSRYSVGNSGFHALNLAVQFGARRIVLVGFDMRLDHGVHWHGRHPPGMNNPSDGMMAHWRRALDKAPATLARLGVEVVNASGISALTAFRKVPLLEAIDGPL